jgi:putative membrane protein
MESFDEIGRSIKEGLMHHKLQTSMLFHVRIFMAKHFVWFSVPFSALIAWVFHTMELIGEHTENPFEGGPNDVPITDMSRGIEIDIRQLIDDTDIPEPYVWVNDIVM